MKTKLTIVKVGGGVTEKEEELQGLLENFSNIQGAKILIHGGGRTATKIAEKLGIKTEMIQGRRITSREMLEVAVMVYGGLVNKNIVAKLQALKVNALGLCGADMNVIEAVKRPVKEIDYGWVGDVTKVNIEKLIPLVQNAVVPVFCALTHTTQGHLLNTNADTIASELAGGFSTHFDVTLLYAFEKKGVLRDVDDNDSLIEELPETLFEEYLEKHIIHEGMIPKLANGFQALKKGVKEAIICQAEAIAEQNLIGTRLKITLK